MEYLNGTCLKILSDYQVWIIMLKFAEYYRKIVWEIMSREPRLFIFLIKCCGSKSIQIEIRMFDIDTFACGVNFRLTKRYLSPRHKFFSILTLQKLLSNVIAFTL